MLLASQTVNTTIECTFTMYVSNFADGLEQIWMETGGRKDLNCSYELWVQGIPLLWNSLFFFGDNSVDKSVFLFTIMRLVLNQQG